MPLLPGEQLGDVRRDPTSAGRGNAILSPQPVRRSEGLQLLDDANYRAACGMFAVNGILFNDESPRRGETFVTRKITRSVARIKAGLEDMLFMGDIDAARDWGYAPEYVEARWRMLQQDEPTDLVVATGTSNTIRDFLQFAFEHAGLDWERHVKFDDRYLRPTEVDSLIGDPSKAAEVLRWKPEVLTPELAGIMVDADFASIV